MTLHIAQDRISSDATGHTATYTLDWAVSWLPDQALSYNDAITAMLIAELITVPGDDPDQHRLLVGSLAAELGLTAEQAVLLVTGTLPPGQLLTVAEMDKAVNDPDDLHFLDVGQLRLLVNHLIVTCPDETAAAICEQQKAGVR